MGMYDDDDDDEKNIRFNILYCSVLLPVHIPLYSLPAFRWKVYHLFRYKVYQGSGGNLTSYST